MKRILLCALTAVAISVSAFSLNTAIAAGDQSAEAARAERMKHRAADHEAMMDARLGGMKAALKLTPDQNPLWEAFENAVRGGAKAREEKKMAEGSSVTRSKGSKRPRESKKIQAFSLAGFGGSVGWLCQAWENMAVIWIRHSRLATTPKPKPRAVSCA